MAEPPSKKRALGFDEVPTGATPGVELHEWRNTIRAVYKEDRERTTLAEKTVQIGRCLENIWKHLDAINDEISAVLKNVSGDVKYEDLFRLEAEGVAYYNQISKELRK